MKSTERESYAVDKQER